MVSCCSSSLPNICSYGWGHSVASCTTDCMSNTVSSSLSSLSPPLPLNENELNELSYSPISSCATIAHAHAKGCTGARAAVASASTSVSSHQSCHHNTIIHFIITTMVVLPVLPRGERLGGMQHLDITCCIISGVPAMKTGSYNMNM